MLYVAAALLLVRAWRRRDARLAVGPILVFSTMAIYAATYVSPRYAVSVGPVLFACVALLISDTDS